MALTAAVPIRPCEPCFTACAIDSRWIKRRTWRHSFRWPGKPEKARSREEFLAHVMRYFRNVRPIGADDASRAVFGVLGRHCDPGEVREVIDALPADIRTVWPDHERYATKASAVQ